MNQSQGLGNASFSVAHDQVLERKDRQRVAKQLVLIMLSFLKRKNFNDLKILDIGCSNGVVTKFLVRHGGSFVGIDVDENAIESAISINRNKKSLSFKLASGTNLPFKNKSFDVVICNQVYSYVSNSKRMMREIYRVLKINGYCFFTGDNLLRLVEPMYNLPFLRWLPKSSAKQVLKLLGYKNIYIGKYQTYWGLLKLCSDFEIEDYTLTVLKQPEKFNFIKILKYRKIINSIPSSFLKLLEPFLPTFIFILKKVKA